MTTTLLAGILVSFVLGLGFTWLVRKCAVSLGLVDVITTRRKIHARPIPRLGGVALVTAFFATLAVLPLLQPDLVARGLAGHREQLVALLGGGIAIALLGVYDDLFGAEARLKFTVQAGVALGLYCAGFQIRHVALPFGLDFDLGVLALPVTVVWVVGITNALNLIDGLDGLAGGVALIVAGSQFVLALASGNYILAAMLSVLIGAVLAFLFFNSNPASIFMGDTGSMFLGVILAAVSLKTAATEQAAVNMLIPMLAFGFPIADTVWAILRRSLKGRPIFSADREHIHHRLVLYLGLSQNAAVLWLCGVSLLLAIAAVALRWAATASATFLLAGVAALGLVVLKKLRLLSLRRLPEMREVRRRNAVLRRLVDTACNELHRAESPAALWLAVRPVIDEVAASSFDVVLADPQQGPGANAVRCITVRAGANGALRYMRALTCNGTTVAQFIVEWSDGRPDLDPETEAALDRLADATARMLAQTQRLQESPAPGSNAVRDAELRTDPLS